MAGGAAAAPDLWREAWSLEPSRSRPETLHDPASRRPRAAARAEAAAVPAPHRAPQRQAPERRQPGPEEAPTRTRRQREEYRPSTKARERAASRPAPRRRAAARPRPHRRPRPGLLRLGFVALWMAVVLLAPLVLNVASMQLDWKLAQLEQQRDDLTAERSQLKTQVATLSSAPRIREAADRLGMSLSPDVDYVILGADGAATVLAEASPATTGGN